MDDWSSDFAEQWALNEMPHVGAPCSRCCRRVDANADFPLAASAAISGRHG